MSIIFWHNVTIPTVTGTETWESIVIRALEERGAWVMTRDSVRFKDTRLVDVNGALTAVPQVDVAFFYWRWYMPQPQYADRQKAYVDQWNYIQAYRRIGTRVVVFDGDHKITGPEREQLHQLGVEVYAPELLPADGNIMLMYPALPPVSIPTTNAFRLRSVTLGYVGNNYERYEQAVRLFGGPAAPVSHFWGNWIDPGPDRKSPHEVERDFPNTVFHGRLSNAAVLDKLLDIEATIHLAKPSYCETGFITMRWAEAAATGTLAMVPSEFAGPPSDIFPRVNDVDDVWHCSLHPSLRKHQRAWVGDVMRVEPWFEVLLS